MLPTTGFFKNIDCPYYEKSCDRPYCHFKHRKKAQEPTEASPASQSTEIPTYNPTPKSQLVNVRSHIPISYVPDLAIRTERNNFRSLSSYRFGDKQPTYNPTPLSILSTSKANSSKAIENSQSDDDTSDITATSKYSPTNLQDNTDDINFEDLETEFDMIDEIISDSGTVDTVNEEAETTEDEKSKKSEKEFVKPKHNAKSHSNSSNSNSKSHDKKHNGKVASTNSKSKSKSDHRGNKSGSHSDKSEKSDSKHKKEHRSSKSSKEKSNNKKDKSSKSSKNEERKKNGKDKHEHKEQKSSERKEKERHKSKPKERDKDRKNSEKDKKHKSKDKNTKKDEKVLGDNKIKSTTSDLFNDNCDMFDNYDNEETNLDYEESDVEEDPMAECYKIFTEYKPTEPEIFPEIKQQQEPITQEETISFGKKRIAHENVDRHKPKTLFTKPKAAPSAAQMMMNRYKAIRLAQANNEQNNIIAEVNRHVLKRPSETSTNDNTKLPKLSNLTVKKAPKPSTSSSLIDDIISGRSASAKPKRIAPVQNVNSIQRAKAKIDEMAKMKAANALKTTTQSISKGQKRVAHVPEHSVTDIPDLIGTERSKLPVNVRTRYLTMIVEECMKLYISTEEAQQRAVNEEYKCYERCAALITYRNSAMLAINRLRKELQEREMSGLGPIMPGEATSTGKDDTCELKGRKFYENIKQCVLNEEELELHGFPREGSTPGRAVIKNKKQVPNQHLDDEYDRVCSRCLKHYRVDDDGLAIYEEECLYHPLKKRTFRGESIYLCCKSGEGAGCVTAPSHVCDKVNPSEKELEGYQTTMPPERDNDPRSFEVFALDCEMCYTTKGLELTRVTVVNADCKTVYETLVKPLNPIIDYNTRFSGITEEQMNRTATSILQVQANILHLCNSNTILIGHSLESDMKALKIIHSSIIDTSVLFPHKFGLPHKRALRDLAREYLKKIIQNDISGHDSAEDALTCMELVQWKVKEEYKTRGIKV